MIKYTQEIIFSIPKTFEIDEIDVAGTLMKRALGLFISEKHLGTFIHDGKLTITDAFGECIWNEKDPMKYYFIGGQCVNELVEDAGINISIYGDIKKEEYNRS